MNKSEYTLFNLKVELYNNFDSNSIGWLCKQLGLKNVYTGDINDINDVFFDLILDARDLHKEKYVEEIEKVIKLKQEMK